METKEFYTSDGKLSAEVSFIEPDVLLTTVVGNADEKSSVEYAGYVTHLFENGSIKAMLVDAQRGGNISPEAINILAKSDAFKFVRRIGVYGINNPIFKIGVESIIKASGRDNIKTFKTREEALGYLKDGS